MTHNNRKAARDKSCTAFRRQKAINQICKVFWKEREGCGEREENLFFRKGFRSFPALSSASDLTLTSLSLVFSAGFVLEYPLAESYRFRRYFDELVIGDEL